MRIDKSQFRAGTFLTGALHPVETMAFDGHVMIAKAQPPQPPQAALRKPPRPEPTVSINTIDAMIRQAQERVAAIQRLLGKR